MIRTAILAGIFLIMLAMSYNRPGVLRDVAQTAATVVTEQTHKTVVAADKPMPEAPVPQPPIPQPSLSQSSVAARPAPAPAAALAPPPVAHDTRDEIVESEIVESEPDMPVSNSPVARDPEPEVLPPARVAAIPRVSDEPAPLPVQTEALPRRLTPTDAAATPVGKPVRLTPLPPAQTAQAVQPAPEPAREVASAPAPAANTAPPAPAEMPVVNVPTRPVKLPWDAPTQARRENAAAAPASTADAGIAPSEDVAPKFMTPQERSRELYRLAREMENTFVDKLAH